MTIRNDAQKEIQRLRDKMNYILHKDERNNKRKTYKRQAWKDRSDNPKNINKGGCIP